VAENGSESCAVAGFGISSVEGMSSAEILFIHLLNR